MRAFLIRITVLLVLLVSSFAVASVGFLPTSNSASADQEVIVPDDLRPDEVGEFVAPLDEQQVRDLLIDNLSVQANANAAAAQDKPVSLIELLKGVNNPYTPLGGGLVLLSNSAQSYFSSVEQVLNTMTDGGGLSGVFKLFGLLALLIICAGLLEFFCLYKWRNRIVSEPDEDEPGNWAIKFKAPLKHFAMHFFGLVLFAASGYLIAAFFIAENTNAYAVMMHLFDVIVKFRFYLMVFGMLVNPAPKGFELIDHTINKSMLMSCISAFLFLTLIVDDGFIVTMYEYGMTDIHYVLSTAVLYGFIVLPLIIGYIWWIRHDIDQILFGTKNVALNADGQYPFAARAIVWPSVVTAALLLVFVIWNIQIITGYTQDQGKLEQAWWLIIIFPLIDLVTASLLYKLTRLPMFQHQRFKQREYRVTYVIRSVVRLIVIMAVVLNIMDALNINILERLGGDKDIVSIMIDIGVTIFVGLIVWEIIQLWIERKLPDEPDSALGEVDGEGGGAAATRTETLLPLLRTTLLIILFLTIVMSVLYTLGVQIAPLLAGAGVVGIAVGFGSQKLVQDIISGVFFLIDDAFRKGEYVELAGLRGTVEKLSVRSMSLRHHLGAVQTIPYSEIQSVKNLSRDWVIMKLELRLPYDVDIEKVRKIIKKVGQEMMQDPEIGPNLLQPLKSQGVMRVEESALIIRMKFTAIPGEQWVIRRVAYTRVRDALAEHGIEFAHREVKVRLPKELEDLQKMDYALKLSHQDKQDAEISVDPKMVNAAAAAAMSSVLAKELAAAEKIDGDADEGGDDR